MINVLSDELLTMNEAAAVLPRLHGRKPNLSTVWRWCKKGCRGVRLEFARVGHSIVTTREALIRFAGELAANDLAREAARESDNRMSPEPDAAASRGPEVRTSARREREIRQAEKRLDARGV